MRILLGGVEGEALSGELGSAHRRIGVLQQGLGIRPVLRAHRDTDTDLDVEGDPRDQERVRQCSLDGAGRCVRPMSVGVWEQDGKLITAQPRHDCAGRRSPRQTRRQLPQEQIPIGMAKRIVDFLEARDIEQQ